MTWDTMSFAMGLTVGMIIVWALMVWADLKPKKENKQLNDIPKNGKEEPKNGKHN